MVRTSTALTVCIINHVPEAERAPDQLLLQARSAPQQQLPGETSLPVGANLGVATDTLGSNDLDTSFVVDDPHVDAASIGLASRIYALGATDRFSSFRPEVTQAGRDVERVTAARQHAETGSVRVGAQPDMTQQLVAEEMLRASTTGVLAMMGTGAALHHNPSDVANQHQTIDQYAALGDMAAAAVGIRDSRATAQTQRGVAGSRASRAVSGSDVTFEAGGGFARAPWAPGAVSRVGAPQGAVGEPSRIGDSGASGALRTEGRGIVPDTTAVEAASEVGAGNNGTPPKLYHYTNEAGMQGILDSEALNPSLKAINPNDVRYDNGQYLSDIAP